MEITTMTADYSPPRRNWTHRDRRSFLYQLLLVLAVVAVIWLLGANVTANLQQQNTSSGFSFLSNEAGFNISERLIWYGPGASYGYALLVGLANTVFVSIVAIVLSSLLGLVVGTCRVAENWLVAALARIYVEAIRNVPLLVHLFVIYAFITISLPGPREAYDPLPGVFVSNRGLAFPSLTMTASWPFLVTTLFLGLALGWCAKKWAGRDRQRAVRRPALLLAMIALAAGIVGAGWLLGVEEVNFPKLTGLNIVGGITVSPELAALIAGLSLYISSYIAEIVRAGILSVSKGQKDAGRSLGFSSSRILRLIVLPQALRTIIPPLTSQYLSTVKNSSLAVAIGFPDLVSVGNTIINQNGQALEIIGIYMVLFLGINACISGIMGSWNRRAAIRER